MSTSYIQSFTRIAILFSITLLISCATKSKLKSLKNQMIATLTPGEDIGFPIDSGTSIYEPNINFHEEGGKEVFNY